MNRKKVFLLAISLVFIVSLISGIAYAQQVDYVPKIVEDFLLFLFKTLPEQAQQGGDIFIVYFKVILFFLVFAVIYYGAEKVFPGKSRIAGLVSIIFALITVIMIPPGVLLFLFTEFSAVISIILALIPILIGIYIRTKIDPDQITLRNIILILIGVVAIFVGGYFIAYGNDSQDAIFAQLGQYTSFGGMAALIVGIILLISAGFRMGGPAGESDGRWLSGGRETPEERATKLEEKEEKKKLEDKEKKEAQANSKMLQLASEMDQVNDKLQDLDRQEISELNQELMARKNHSDILDRLENNLLNTWNSARALFNAVGYYKSNAQAFEERADELEGYFKKYQNYIVKLGAYLQAFKQSLQNQQKRTVKFQKLLSKHNKLTALLGNISSWSLQSVKLMYNFQKKEERDATKISDLENKLKRSKPQTDKAKYYRGQLTAIKNIIKSREQLLFNQFKELKDLRNADSELGRATKNEGDLVNELSNLDQDDIKICENNIKKISRFSKIGSLRELIRGLAQRFIWLGTQDVRLLYNDVKKLKNNNNRKIQILQQLEALESKEQDVEDHINNVVKQLERFDAIFAAETKKALDDLK